MKCRLKELSAHARCSNQNQTHRRHHVWDRRLFAEEISDRDSIGPIVLQPFLFLGYQSKDSWSQMLGEPPSVRIQNTLLLQHAVLRRCCWAQEEDQEGQDNQTKHVERCWRHCFSQKLFFHVQSCSRLCRIRRSTILYCTVARSTLPGESTQFVTHNFFTHKSQSFIHSSHLGSPMINLNHD